jgi:hypothetical protein
MPTNNNASAAGAKAGVKSARKPASATARRNGTAPRKSTRAKATPNARAADRSAAAIGDYAERAVLIPVGAALIAREQVVSGVTGAVSTYSSTSKAKAQLRRFERRGATARNRLEREVRKVRVRVERELRQRRREIEKRVGGIEERRETVAKNSSDLASRVQERILNFV